jgi:DNA-binding transcriptional MocR family regulator
MTDLLNLSRCYPRNARQEAVVRDYLTRAATDMMVDYGRYEAAAGTTAQQAALVSFLADEPAGQGALVLTGGGQSALAAAFDFLCPPGSTVLVEAISFPLFRQLAGRRGVHVRSIASDEQGPKPEAFAEALEQGARVLYTMPTLHNPLGSVMPEPRRRELAAVARRHDGWILEDDAFQFLDTSGLPSLRSLAPERTLRVFSLSKMLSLSLRLGAVVVPPALAGDIAERVRESGNNAAGHGGNHGGGWRACRACRRKATRRPGTSSVGPPHFGRWHAGASQRILPGDGNGG